MPLPDLIARTVRDPMTQGNPGEMHRLLDLVEALPARLGTDEAGVRALFSRVGMVVRDALATVRHTGDEELLMVLIRRGCGLEPDARAVSAVMPGPMRDIVVADVARTTGLGEAVVAGALPVVVPAVLKLLDAGSCVRHCERRKNEVLEAFLGASGTWDGDMGEAVRQLSAARKRTAPPMMAAVR